MSSAGRATGKYSGTSFRTFTELLLAYGNWLRRVGRGWHVELLGQQFSGAGLHPAVLGLVGFLVLPVKYETNPGMEGHM